MMFKPYSYQQYGMDFILNNAGAGLFLDMG